MVEIAFVEICPATVAEGYCKILSGKGSRPDCFAASEDCWSSGISDLPVHLRSIKVCARADAGIHSSDKIANNSMAAVESVRRTNHPLKSIDQSCRAEDISGSVCLLGRTLLDHLVGAREKRWRQCHADGSGNLIVDRHLKPGRLFKWHFSRVAARKDARNKIGGT
jgi:hypothetical protein